MNGDTFEELRSMEQALTFQSCAETFSDYGVVFAEDKYPILGIRNHAQGLYTNLGLLMSDQCVHTVKIAVFADEENTVFRDRKEFTGSVFAQMKDAFAYLQLCNQNRSVIDGLTRKDYWDYPKDAIREALINALIHRDYSFSGSIIINVNEKSMEFISIGGLLPGLLPEDIQNGISQLRNRNLAEAFHRLNLIESYGTGIRRIMALYNSCPTKPDITVTPNTFKMTLPNMNAQHKQASFTPVITGQMRRVLECLTANPDITDAELQQVMQIKSTRLYMLISQMESAGLIRIEGRGKNKKYTVIPQSIPRAYAR